MCERHENIFIYVVIDREKGNLGLARRKIDQVDGQLELKYLTLMVEFPFDFALSLVAFLSAAQHGVFGANAVMPRLRCYRSAAGGLTQHPVQGDSFLSEPSSEGAAPERGRSANQCNHIALISELHPSLR